jgi:hypothetical protein
MYASDHAQSADSLEAAGAVMSGVASAIRELVPLRDDQQFVPNR